MSSIIVALPRQEDARKIGSILNRRGMEVAAICTTAASVLSQVHQLESGVVICGRNFKDMHYSQLAEYLPDYFQMLLLTQDPEPDTEHSNIVMVLMPFKPQDLINTVDMILTQIMRRIKKQKTGPKKRSEEERNKIDEAKLLLMERNHMTEQEAFRYIQKSSMDSGTNMVETAQMILLLNYE